MRGGPVSPPNRSRILLVLTSRFGGGCERSRMVALGGSGLSGQCADRPQSMPLRALTRVFALNGPLAAVHGVSGEDR